MEAVYVDHMGDDLRIVNAAKVSFNRQSVLTEDGKLKEADKRLIQFLARGYKKDDWDSLLEDLWEMDKVRDIERAVKEIRNHAQHWTPFSHPQITIRERVPIFVARQRFKHMIGFTYNEVSRRYVDSPPEFFRPTGWRKRAEDKKQGSLEELVETNSVLSQAYDAFVEQCELFYNNLLDSNVCPEQARMVLPQSMYTEYYVTGSLAAWARAYKQRIDSHAQKEIQDLAKQWDAIISPLFTVAWPALTD